MMRLQLNRVWLIHYSFRNAVYSYNNHKHILCCRYREMCLNIYLWRKIIILLNNKNMTTWKVVAGCACAVKLLSGRQAALMRLRAAVGSGSLAARLLPCSYLHSAHSAQGQTPSARVVACSSHGSTAAQRSFERIFHLSAPDGIRSGNITEDSRRSEVL